MKTIFYILIALCMTTSFTACTTDSVEDNLAITTDEIATNGQDGTVDPDEDVGGGN